MGEKTAFTQFLASSLAPPCLLLGLLNSMARVWERAVSLLTSRNLVESEP